MKTRNYILVSLTACLFLVLLNFNSHSQSLSFGVEGGFVNISIDGIPDFLDKCPHHPVGVPIDSIGCPMDSDNDDVADSLDDCPNALYGVEVDVPGCSNSAIIEKSLVPKH